MWEQYHNHSRKQHLSCPVPLCCVVRTRPQWWAGSNWGVSCLLLWARRNRGTGCVCGMQQGQIQGQAWGGGLRLMPSPAGSSRSQRHQLPEPKAPGSKDTSACSCPKGQTGLDSNAYVEMLTVGQLSDAGLRATPLDFSGADTCITASVSTYRLKQLVLTQVPDTSHIVRLDYRIIFKCDARACGNHASINL